MTWIIVIAVAILAPILIEVTSNMLFGKKNKVSTQVDMTERLVAAGAPELPDGYIYEYGIKSGNLLIVGPEAREWHPVNMSSAHNDPEDDFVNTALILYSRFNAKVGRKIEEAIIEKKLKEYALQQDEMPVIVRGEAAEDGESNNLD